MKRGDAGRRLYKLTPLGEREILKAFAALGVSEEAARGSGPLFPELREGESAMPNNDERYRATAGFQLGPYRICRGDYLSDAMQDELERCGNRNAIKSSFLIRERPPAGWRSINRSAAPVVSAGYAMEAPPDWLILLAQQCTPDSWAWRLAEAVIATNKPLSTAVDAVPSAMYSHAVSEFGLVKKPGEGSVVRRSVSYFNEFLTLVIRRVKSQAKKEAA
jgi:hypothetical protein